MRLTLLAILDGSLRLLHPLMPFITDALWQKISLPTTNPGMSIMTQPYPSGDLGQVDETALSEIAWIQDVVSGIRNIRGEMDISPAKPIPVLFFNGSSSDQERLGRFRDLLDFLIRPESISWMTDDSHKPAAATALVGQMELLVPITGLIDKQAELGRLDKEIDRLQKDHQKAENKINNPDFVEKAPAEVVNKERDKLQELEAALEKLIEQRTSVADL